MSAAIVIIGSGFGAYQLIKTIRRTDQNLPITVFTLDAGHDYNKPDLSHVFSKQQSSSDLIRMAGEAFAQTHNITLHAYTEVESIDTNKQTIWVKNVAIPYAKLVFATGAKTFMPLLQGNAAAEVVTLNSLADFERSQRTLHGAKRLLIMGAGLIGTEMAMDFTRSGKQVVLVDPCQRIMESMLPDVVANTLHKNMQGAGVNFALGKTVTALHKTTSGLRATLNSGEDYEVDCVLSAAGLTPNIALAKKSGIYVNKGIKVDKQLQTSSNNVYALGDCAEINGNVMSYLQPIMLSANVLAKTLLGEPTELKLPLTLVNVKTPLMPMQLAGKTVKGVNSWQVDIDTLGCSVKAFNAAKQMVGFIVTEGHMKKAFPMLKALSVNA